MNKENFRCVTHSKYTPGCFDCHLVFQYEIITANIEKRLQELQEKE